MYAGAVASLLAMITNLIIIGNIKKAFLATHPASGSVAQSVAGAAAFAVIASGLLSIVLWLWLASAAKNRRRWPRRAGTVLFCLDTIGLLATLGRTGIPAAKGFAFIIWLIALATVIILWRRPARAWMA